MFRQSSRKLLVWNTRRLSTKTTPLSPSPPPPPKGDLFDKLGSFVGSKNLLIGGGLLVGSIVLLPPFANTRDGFLAGLRYEPSTPVMWFYEALAGGLGVLGGSFVVNAYLRKRSQSVGDPVILALRLPYAVFGGLLGACTCFALSDHMVRFSTKFGKTTGYTVDGFLMDVSNLVGGEGEGGGEIVRPWDSQNETFDNSTWGVFNRTEDSTATEAVKNNRREIEKTREEIHAQDKALAVTNTANTADYAELKELSKESTLKEASSSIIAKEDQLEKIRIVREKHLDNLVASLVGLRLKEAMLKEKYESLDPVSALAQSIQVERDICEDEKIALKEEGKEYGCPRITKLLRLKVNSQVMKLSELRVEQEKLAMIVADRFQDKTSKRKAMETIRKTDRQKAVLKKVGKEKYGTNISGLAVRRKNWKKTIAEATALDLTIKVA